MMGKVAEVKLVDNSKEVLDAFQKQVSLAMQAIGQTAEGYAKEDCPVDTGRLRNSISNQVEESEKAVYIGTNVEYASAVEYNDTAKHENGKAHFLRDSATMHSDEYSDIMRTALEGKGT